MHSGRKTFIKARTGPRTKGRHLDPKTLFGVFSMSFSRGPYVDGVRTVWGTKGGLVDQVVGTHWGGYREP